MIRGEPFKARYSSSYETGAGNVDSGPLILGYGIPATAFAFADAVALGDYRNAQRLRRVISLGSRTIREGNELRYGVRVVPFTLLLGRDGRIAQVNPRGPGALDDAVKAALAARK